MHELLMATLPRELLCCFITASGDTLPTPAATASCSPSAVTSSQALTQPLLPLLLMRPPAGGSCPLACMSSSSHSLSCGGSGGLPVYCMLVPCPLTGSHSTAALAAAAVCRAALQKR
ncbi:hypothetical protein COO60DRAFT_1190982 [Scenedesmus sp. NREL 46B-D3]|nr:hypothetical protein COO60DRAFT_1190982 [Scenedesmus sp. NREL 46B-D3]